MITQLSQGVLVCTKCKRSFRTKSAPAKFFCSCATPTVKAALSGPGTEFSLLAASFGLAIPCGGCKQLLADMNRWGPAGCRERRAEILRRLKENEAKLKWGEWLAAGTKAALAGYTSMGQIVDKAIALAAAKESAA